MRSAVILFLFVVHIGMAKLMAQDISLGIFSNASQKIVFSKKNTSQTSANEYIAEYMARKYEKGFTYIRIDSQIFFNKALIVYVSNDSQKIRTKIISDSISFNALNSIGIDSLLLLKKTKTLYDFEKLRIKIITYFENSGYPFVAVQLQNINYTNDSLIANIQIIKGKYITLDSIRFEPSDIVNRKFLYRYLNLKPKAFYQEIPISLATKRLNQLEFLRATSAPKVFFEGAFANVILNLKAINANEADGLIGFVPSATGALQFNGDARLKLVNTFKRGESINFKARFLPFGTQNINIALYYPYIFNTTFGLEPSFTLFKQDSTFINSLQALGISYLFSGQNRLKVFAETNNNNVINAAQYALTTSLPALANVKKTSYGLGLILKQTNNVLNPSKGTEVEATGAIAKKIISKNPFVAEALYNNVAFNTTEYRYFLHFNNYISLAKRFVLNTGLLSEGIFAPKIFNNELYRVGGIRQLRGFLEQNFTTSQYAVAKIELRYLIDESSRLFIFSDIGKIKNVTQGANFQSANGFGVGITLGTGSGLFTLVYAIGLVGDNNVVNLQNGKIHFGYTSYF